MRRLQPEDRVLVFVDGQNAYKTCEALYGHGPCHPLLLAERVREGRKLVGVRFYSGIHNPNVDPSMHGRAARRHALMRRVGVTVVERTLRYRWEWGFDPRSLPDPREHRGEKREVVVTPYQRAREKGIDLAMGLDVIDLAIKGFMDVAVIISSDNDLCEAARATHQATVRGGRVSVEAAMFNESKPRVLSHYDYTHQLRREDFEEARDTFDYREPDVLAATWLDAFVDSCKQLTTEFPDWR